MLGKLIDAMQRAGIDFDSKSLADAIWLAHQVRGTSPFPAKTAPSPAEAEPLPASDQPHVSAFPSLADSDAIPAPLLASSVALRAATGAVAVAAHDYASMRLPAPRALRGDLSAALGPMARRDPRPGHVIDVEATVDGFAATGNWTEIDAPGDRRWLRATLIAEAGPQAPLWHSTLEEFTQVLRTRGAFRTVRRKELCLGPNGEALLREPGSSVGTEALRTAWSRDDIVLVASDFVAPAWPAAFGLCIERWRQTNHVMLLHLLPRHLWGRTWTGVPDLMVSGQAPGGDGNSLLASARQARPARKHTPVPPQPVPIAGLTPDDLRAWSRVVAAEPGRALAVSLVNRLGAPQSIPIAGAARTSDSLVRAFKGNASPLCIKLGTYLSLTAPLTFQMMQWVQLAMVRDASTAELAEFFLSGLLEKKYDAASPADVVYDFAPGVRELLERGVSICEAADVHRAIGAKLELHSWSDGKVGSLVDVEILAARTDLPTAVRMFAQVSASYLQRSRVAQGSVTASVPTFLTAQEVAAKVRQSIDRSDYIVEQLLLFATPTQQTWLIFCTNTLVIVLDDVNTRARGKEVQERLPMAAELAAFPAINPNGSATVGFSNYDGRWYYSKELFPHPEALNDAFRAALVAVGERRNLHDKLMQAAAFSTGLGKFSAGTSLFLAIRPPMHHAVNVSDLLVGIPLFHREDGAAIHLLYASLSPASLRAHADLFEEMNQFSSMPPAMYMVRISVGRTLRLLDSTSLYDRLQSAASEQLTHERSRALENAALMFIERHFDDIDGLVWRPPDDPKTRLVCLLAERVANDLRVEAVDHS
jgi:hypothetical protein